MKGDWILSLYADEVILDVGREEILRSIATADPIVNGFSFPRLSRYLKIGGFVTVVDGSRTGKVRLVRRDTGCWSGDSLHEKLEVSRQS